MFPRRHVGTIQPTYVTRKCLLHCMFFGGVYFNAGAHPLMRCVAPNADTSSPNAETSSRAMSSKLHMTKLCFGASTRSFARQCTCTAWTWRPRSPQPWQWSWKARQRAKRPRLTPELLLVPTRWARVGPARARADVEERTRSPGGSACCLISQPLARPRVASTHHPQSPLSIPVTRASSFGWRVC